jgi:hypothetical protein
MRRSVSARWAMGTLAIVAIALSLDSIRHTARDADATRGPRLAIRGQLAAFQRGDYRAAYQFAAPEIQEQMPLADFRRMVEAGYPELARWSRLTLGPSQRRGDTVGVPVAVTAKDGSPARFVYWMQYEVGGWRVAGVERAHPSGGPRPGGSPQPLRRPEWQETTALDRAVVDG